MDYQNIFLKYQKFCKLNRVIVQEFIDKIYISKINKEDNKRNIKIIWKFESSD